MTGLNTAAMTGLDTPIGYFHQIVGLIPDMVGTLVQRLNNPLVIVFVILAIVIGFLTGLNNN